MFVYVPDKWPLTNIITNEKNKKSKSLKYEKKPISRFDGETKQCHKKVK